MADARGGSIESFTTRAHHSKWRNHGAFGKNGSLQKVAVVPYDAVPPLPVDKKKRRHIVRT